MQEKTKSIADAENRISDLTTKIEELNALKEVKVKSMRERAIASIHRRQPKKRDVARQREQRLEQLDHALETDDEEAKRLYERRTAELNKKLEEAEDHSARQTLETELRQFKRSYQRIHETREAKVASAKAIIEGEAEAHMAKQSGMSSVLAYLCKWEPRTASDEPATSAAPGTRLYWTSSSIASSQPETRQPQFQGEVQHIHCNPERP